MRPIHSLVPIAILVAATAAFAQAGAPEPGRTQAGAPEPGRAQAGAPEPDRAQAGAPEPDRAQAGAPEPDRAQAEAPEPDRAQAEAAEPRSRAQAPEEPRLHALPDLDAPDAVPDAVPGAAAAEPEIPDLTLDQALELLDEETKGDEAAPEPPVTWESLVARGALIAQQAPRQLPRFVNGAIDDWTQVRMTRRAQIVAGALVAMLAMLTVLLTRLVRGFGDVAVLLHYPTELRGTFSVCLSGRPAPANRNCRVKNPDDARRQGSSRRTAHHMVSRETSFHERPCRRVWVQVDGFLETEGGEVVSTHFAESEVRPVRGGVQRVEFDLSPRACPVEVRVCWDRKAVEGALVARRGAPGSMRFARGAVHFSLDRGEHTLVVGHADRVCEVPLRIESFQPVHLEIDVAERAHVLFTGCPPAVEPYLNGDVSAAARALERDGQTETAHRMLARFHLDRDHVETAAKHFESAGDLREAADLRQSLHQFEKAAALFEKIGEDDLAAENFRSAGKLLRAGDAYARASAWDSAVECFRRAGDVARWIEALEKKGEVFDAALVALDQGDRARAIQCLGKVGAADPNYAQAAVRLAEAYYDQGHGELALEKIDELMATRRDQELDESGLDRLATMLDGVGEYERAIHVLERLRLQDPTWPKLASRIQEARQKASRDLEVSAPPSVPGATVFSQEFRYEILEEIGRGGMGVVFRARDRRLGRTVALKRLPDNLRNHPKAVELFLREARAAAALNHPNIVTLFDAGQDGDTFYLTMELLEGMPLQRVLTQRGQLSPAHVAKLGGQVATGLHYAHEQGIVHRDIKTANFFFTNKKLVKIMDFGLAKMVEEVRRATTVIGGTPYYMAPEQSAGEAVDRRADIYALGVTLYELLSGRVPFKEGDVAFHHRHTAPPDLRGLVPDVPEDFAVLIEQMMAKKAADRVATAEEVRARLQVLAGAAPGPARGA